ncbi:PAS domain S-box protein [Rossellomorea vietnamensis]|uniref:histidine kinase n=2 Tax=Rossellomorea TaxID=2837508 RepID=A0A5D4KKK8_9BACI|nr:MULTISPECIES: ATP-binding protein [Rossellomorea]TYR77386.1 PAS domain S-box protein [Rossellomorea vietnamensis]TYS82334.1 PAS domain S-box protein [Rossellomorea aquimaris]
MGRYKGRITSFITVALFVVAWDYIFYIVLENDLNLVVDIVYTILILGAAVWLGGYYDRHKRNLEQLKESEEKYRTLSDEMSLVLEEIDEVVFRTDSQGQFQFLNPAWESFSGYSVNESINANALHFLPLQQRHEVLPIIRTSIKEKAGSTKVEVLYRTKDGGNYWAELHIKLNYDDKGVFKGTIGTISDITHRVYAEEELMKINENLAVQSQKLSIAGQLAAGIAHEVRNPLTAINGFLQLMKSDSNTNQYYLDIIFAEIKRIEMVLSELLMLAKPQAVQFKEKNVLHILQQVTALLQTNATLFDVSIHQQFTKKELFIKCDENQIKQVFINLIKNAIEAQPEGGNIYISANELNGQVLLTFQDEGNGMDEKTLNKLGEPFYTTKEKGTGLGFMVCLRILKDHHGSIHVQSEKGKGTTFDLTLPAALPKKSKRAKEGTKEKV